MKRKDKRGHSETKHRNQTHNDDVRRSARRLIWMRAAAILLLIAFLASECSTLIFVE